MLLLARAACWALHIALETLSARVDGFEEGEGTCVHVWVRTHIFICVEQTAMLGASALSSPHDCAALRKCQLRYLGAGETYSSASSVARVAMAAAGASEKRPGMMGPKSPRPWA